MPTSPIFESLITCRNILFTNKINVHIIPTLQSLLDSMDHVEIKNSKNILIYCINQAIHQIEENHLKSAGEILNLIHNIPMTQTEFLTWKIDYFLSIEMVRFLDKYDEIVNSRNISLYIFSEVSKLYPPQV